MPRTPRWCALHRARFASVALGEDLPAGAARLLSEAELADLSTEHDIDRLIGKGDVPQRGRGVHVETRPVRRQRRHRQ